MSRAYQHQSAYQSTYRQSNGSGSTSARATGTENPQYFQYEYNYKRVGRSHDIGVRKKKNTNSSAIDNDVGSLSHDESFTQLVLKEISQIEEQYNDTVVAAAAQESLSLSGSSVPEVDDANKHAPAAAAAAAAASAGGGAFLQ